ncbi:GNAT family N-acetyltransferase [Dactylosporangium sp. CS-033363]|uniref:GNAT family N-acetyltransferase n=1 Tax=Dactylosporangium sp. CS-033363 TaxID=3239935 RepID=UPI003D932CC5
MVAHWANTETKLLTLGHAFDTLAYDAVVWRIAPDNVRSRRAIVRVGATLTGREPDLLVYTMPRAAWPAAKALLDRRYLDE